MTTGEILCAGTVKELSSLVAYYNGINGVLMLLEMQPAWTVDRSMPRENLLRFTHFDAESITLERKIYTSGRLFHKDFELRWEQQGSQIRLVYLGMRDHCPEMRDIKEISLQGCRQQDTGIYLFGKRLEPERLKQIGLPNNEGSFAEVRIPRLLQYPVSERIQGTQRLQLMVREFIDEKTASVVAFRFMELVGAK